MLTEVYVPLLGIGHEGAFLKKSLALLCEANVCTLDATSHALRATCCAKAMM